MDTSPVADWAAPRLERLSRSRRAHSLGVAGLAALWAPRWGVAPDDAYGAGLVHDLAREWDGHALVREAERLGWPVDEAERESPLLLHGPVAAAWMREAGVGSPAMQAAVRYHTTAAPSLDALGQLIFVADALEPGREYSGVEALRSVAAGDVTAGYRAVLASTRSYLAARGLRVHPRTEAAWAVVAVDDRSEEEAPVSVADGEAQAWAARAAAVAEDHKAQDVVVLDMGAVTLLADYFVIMTGQSVRQVDTLADYIDTALQAAGARLRHREGRSRAHWVLLDYGDVVVHIFTPDERRYYDLERLWGDARVVGGPPAT